MSALDTRPVPLRGGGLSPRLRWGIAAAGIAGSLLVWQLAVVMGWLGSRLLPSPIEVGKALGDLVTSGELWPHLIASVERVVLGWSAGVAVGLLVGLAIGVSTLARSLSVPLVSALFPIPKIALLPLFILWLGIGEASKISTIAFGVFFPTVISVWTAVDGVPRGLIRMGRSFGLSRGAILRTIVLPGALPGILGGFRISTSIALILVVSAEMIGAEFGVGALVLTSGHLLQTDRLLAGVVILSILGVLSSIVLGSAERWLLRWR